VNIPCNLRFPIPGSLFPVWCIVVVGQGAIPPGIRGMNCIHLGTPEYPQLLAEISDPPSCIWTRGDRAAFGSTGVAVIGARAASEEGLTAAYEIAFDLARAGIVVISGLARGVDSAAHRGALDAAGRTIAVLGCGPDVAYPAAHRSLWRRICETGLVISEFPPGAAPWRWTFPARNRIMAALAGMTVVVEGATRSGSLITADLAADLGRDLGAVPGPVTSRASSGTNNLLAGGACVVRGAQDVLDAMLGAGAERVERTGPALDGALATVLAAVEAGAASCDAVAASLGLPGPDTAAALARLEALGYLACSPLGAYSRSLLAVPVHSPSNS
jgi:DNA processing protein